ncbi:MAG: hypothetical protein ACRDID_06495, partial [Ktedonobacterales bacterium]
MDTQDPQNTPDDVTASPELAAANDTPSGAAADGAEGSATPAAEGSHTTASDEPPVASANDEGVTLPDTDKLPIASAGAEAPGAPLTEGALIGEYRIVGSGASADGPVFFAEPQEPPAAAE